MIWQKIARQVHSQKINLLLIFSIAGSIIAAGQLGLFRTLEWGATDQLFQIRTENKVDDRIVIVTIEEADIQYLNQWPMADGALAQVIRNISAQNPRAIALDLYRDIPVPPGHEELVKVFETTPNLIGVQKVGGNTIAPAPKLAEKGQVAANDLILDADGKIRRGTVLLKNGESGLIEGFGIKLAMMFLEQENINLELIDEAKNIYGLGKTKFIPLSAQDGQYQKNDMGGYQVMLNYTGGLNSFLQIPLTAVLENKIPADFLKDKIVLIGPIAPSLNDIHQTPYNNTLFFSHPLVPGIVIHANFISQILNAALEDRPMLRPTVKYLNWGFIIICTTYSTVLGTMYVRNRWLTFVGIWAIITLWLIGAYIAFLVGWLIPIFTPIFTVVSASVISIIASLWINLKETYRELALRHQELKHTYQELEATSESYSRFVPFDYLSFLKKDKILDVKLGDHVNKEMSILFSDIRSFTPLAESMTPKENFDFINAYLQQLSPEIRNNNGLIVKFLGDGVMAIFPNEVEDALSSAIAQLQQLELFNQERAKLNQLPIRIGLAIHFGKVMFGIVGEESRMQSDILSDNVNLTARLESLTKFYGIPLLVSETVMEHLPEPKKYSLRFIDRVAVKGKNRPIDLYESFDLDPAEIKAVKESTMEQYNQAIALYQQAKFMDAYRIFQSLLTLNPKDTILQIYVQRTQELAHEETGINWDGVWRFTEKY